MKNVYLALLFTIVSLSCVSQVEQPIFSYENFENEIISYEPKQNDLSEKDFNHGVMILSETKKYVKNDPANFNRADYFNVLSAFISLDENETTLNLAFQKLVESDESCEYFLDPSLFSSSKYDIFRKEIEELFITCASSYPDNSAKFELDAYAQENKLNLELLQQIQSISKADEKYRKEETTDWSKQKLLDQQNQESIDSLFEIHKTYLGRTLVGKEFESVMWAVIQHSNLEMMETYLPAIHEAVSKNELDIIPFKMLLDRYYGLKYGYQLFGSQSGFGFELATDEVRKEIELKYGLE